MGDRNNGGYRLLGSELALILSTFSPKKELRDSKPHSTLTCYRRAPPTASINLSLPELMLLARMSSPPPIFIPGGFCFHVGTYLTSMYMIQYLL